ncbi:MAG: cation:proton antiporter [Gammaproteobacteria bacterium]
MHLDFAGAVALILLLGVVAQWISWRIHLPAIILLSLSGLLAGPVLHVLQPQAEFGHAFLTIISLSVAVILFEGGLNLRISELKQAAVGVRRLAYLGVPISFVLYALATHYVGGLSWPVASVFGAIIVVTGPTVIIPLLRGAMLTRRVASYLKWEAIINDPIGALLAVLVFEYFVYAVSGRFSGQMLWDLATALTVGALLGGGVAYLLGQSFRRNLVPEYLKYPITLALVITVFVSANAVQDQAGLLAVTVMGMVMGNMRLPSIEEMRRFKEYISILLVSTVFILLTANLNPHILKHLRWDGGLLILVIMLVARPLAVWIATLGAGMQTRERMLLAWIAPRGVVAVATVGVMAPRLLAAGYADANLLVPLMFALVFATVLVHGLTLGKVARMFGLAAAARNRLLIVGASPWTTELARALMDTGVNALVVDNSWHRLRTPRLAGVQVFYGEILSESAEASLELHDVGVLLAATSNDAYNALVCTAFAPSLGHGQVFQLPMYAAESTEQKGVMRGMRGRIAFGEDALYEDLWQKLTRGWAFQKTPITEAYTFNSYLADCSPETMQIALVRADGGLALHSTSMPIAPKTGDTVISFGLPRKETASQPAEPDAITGTLA